ncbi:glycerate kinase [Cellulomonas sp. C5510]|uniref:glycerate kinase family protein n=1 Tax=Cellulomonas sp. C5510 TaxID=2871170 RepID=UPI001C939C31|nr:glycerate kinase [Cellulomonas sp. C5510]QZN86558.1 glycerate kinase [Cellulomonas sp. C5510]
MKVVVALDSFKGCLSSAEAGDAARVGVLAAVPGADVRVVPVADGGEGTVDALLAAVAGQRVEASTVDALGRPVTAAYALLPDGTAVVEAASCVGPAQVGPVDATLPPRAGSAGVGLLVRHAVDAGARRVAVALGGTACTDGGAGLLIALGARVSDADGRPVPAAGVNPLWSPCALDPSSLPDLGDVGLLVLTDVDSPLHGPAGAAHVFAPQKGATAVQVRHLDDRLAAWGAALAAAGRPVADLPGAGAAGGLGAALLALGARREPGFAFVARAAGLADALVGADLVLTGEGRVDGQTAHGKAPAGVAALARDAGAVVVALAGSVARGGDPGATAPFDAVLAVQSGPRPLAEALDPGIASDELAATAGEVARLVRAAGRHHSRG